MHYWPTYAAMDKAQQRWYFYWRSQVRRGNFIPTDLSYIFVHIYELLNLVENPEPVAAAGRIWLLWKRYRLQHPKLDHYLPDWGGDLLALKQGIAAGALWWQSIAPSIEQPPAPIINLLVHHWVEGGRSADIPYPVWLMLMDYRPRNKFYQEHNHEGRLDLGYAQAIRASDEYWQRTEGQSVLVKFTSPSLHAVRKPMFASALVGYAHPSELEWGESRNYLGAARLSEHLTSTVKYAENILRKQAGYPHKLSGITISSGLSQVLDASFAPAAPPPPEPLKITLDQRRVAALHQESEQIGSLLENVAAEEAPAPPKVLYTDLAEMRLLWRRLAVSDRLILAGMFQGDIPTVPTLAQRLAADAVLPQLFIDHINQLALDLLGDRLVYVRDDVELSLAEDYMDELDVVLAETPPETKLDVPQPNESDAPWDQFFGKLAPAEIALIRLFAAEERLTEAAIESAARPYHVMANAVLDGLNEKGAEALGHPPLYLDHEHWRVEADDLADLRQRLSYPEVS